MSRATKYALAVAVLFMMLLAAVGGSYGLSEWAVSRNDRQWCETLRLLTSQPVTPPSDPAQNPSRVASYKLYEDFVHVKAEFGC